MRTAWFIVLTIIGLVYAYFIDHGGVTTYVWIVPVIFAVGLVSSLYCNYIDRRAAGTKDGEDQDTD